jgi:hypothetical protein
MRIYEGSPRQDWEEVLRSVGAYLDQRGMRDLVFLETESGFIIQGTAVSDTQGSSWGDAIGKATHETFTLKDDEVGEFMDTSLAQRGQEPDPTPKHYESQLRVIGRYLDEQHPRDVFFFELDGAYVVRMASPGLAGLKHELVEFTRDDLAALIANAPAQRRSTKDKDKPA